MEPNNDNINKFIDLLNIFDGVRQAPDGPYAGMRLPLSREQLMDHFTGQRAYAFCVSAHRSDGKKVTARFAAFDIDRNFRERLFYFCELFNELRLDRHSFVTGGSTLERGKIIIPLVDGIDRFYVSLLLELMLSELSKRKPELFPAASVNGDIELYPRRPRNNDISSGVLRIGGRNIARGGALESFASINGEAVVLDNVIAASGGKVRWMIRKLGGVPRPRLPRALRGIVKSGLRWNTFPYGVRGIRRWMSASAFHLRRIYRNDAIALATYQDLLKQLISNSPELDQPSQTYRDHRNPLKRELEELTVWQHAVSQKIWEPGVFPSASDSALRAYRAFTEFAAHRQLREHCFGIDVERAADIMGMPNKSAVYKAITCGVRENLIVKLHPGSRHRKDAPGLPTMYGLVGLGETPHDVWADAVRHERLLQRYRQSPVLGITDPSRLYSVPTLEYWDRVKASTRSKPIEGDPVRQAVDIVRYKLSKTETMSQAGTETAVSSGGEAA